VNFCSSLGHNNSIRDIITGIIIIIIIVKLPCNCVCTESCSKHIHEYHMIQPGRSFDCTSVHIHILNDVIKILSS